MRHLVYLTFTSYTYLYTQKKRLIENDLKRPSRLCVYAKINNKNDKNGAAITHEKSRLKFN